ncbi:MAG: hypothetical protein M3Z64_06560 [Verrucomicrobiota bacterium]|nr:hypothetical protein [Verrucomicrobiota bacterium]
MDGAAGQNWYLRKHDDETVFGPLTFAQLARWAWTARVAPHDWVSTDQSTWMKAPMLAELGMDWLVEVTSERYYGPTTLGAIQEFVRLGEIQERTSVVNTCDATRHHVRELEITPLAGDAEEANNRAPAASGMSIDPQVRIRELEQALDEERRSLAESEARCRELEARLAQQTSL